MKHLLFLVAIGFLATTASAQITVSVSGSTGADRASMNGVETAGGGTFELAGNIIINGKIYNYADGPAWIDGDCRFYLITLGDGWILSGEICSDGSTSLTVWQVGGNSIDLT
ncbi:MAG: hypothetical protein ACI97A_004426 [Planctomycetota bacterium]|jgi:hypothetical protein